MTKRRTHTTRPIRRPIRRVERIQPLPKAKGENREQLYADKIRCQQTLRSEYTRKRTAKKMPDSCNMRATQICIVPTYLYPSKTVTSFILLLCVSRIFFSSQIMK
jgi:hypothetical protein